MTKGLSTRPITDCRLVFSIKDQLPIECDVLLPEYCPDIVRVIFAKANCICSSITFGNQEVQVNGITGITVCYESDDGRIKKAEYSVPFRKSYEVSEELSDPIGYCFADNASISCKTASKRRFDIRGTLALSGMVFNLTEVDAVEKSDNPNLIVKTEKLESFIPYKNINEVVTIREEILSPANKPPIGEIISIDMQGVPEMCKSQSKILSLKGNLLMHIIYSYGENNQFLESFDTSIPINQVWDSYNFEDNFIFEAFLNCMSVSLSKSDEVIKENGKLLLEAELGASIFSYAPKNISIAVDAFSPAFETDIVTNQVKLIGDISEISETQNTFAEIPPPSDIREVSDCSSLVKSLTLVNEDNVKKCFCDIEFSITGKNADGAYVFFRHTIREVIVLENAATFDIVHPISYTTDTSALLSNGKLRLSAVLNIFGNVFSPETAQIITDIILNEEKPAVRPVGFAMIVFYADKNDDIWSIAKKYKVDPERIKKENSLTTDTFDKRTALIIPV